MLPTGAFHRSAQAVEQDRLVRGLPMRFGIVLLVGLMTFGVGEPAARYGIAPDLKTFPQATAKEALASVLKAVEAKRFDYLVAQLADPEFVDDRVKRLYAGK